MPTPRVFISSSYVDLIDARSVVEQYFRELLYETVTYERGGIYYDHTKPLDVSCYEAVKECDLMVLIIGGRYGSPSSKDHDLVDRKIFNSITKMEYLEALSAGIPIFTFIKQNVYNEYFVYINQPLKYRKNFRPKFVDNVQIFRLIKEIKDLRANNLIIEYESAPEILQYLKKATASWVHDAIKNKKKLRESDKDRVLVNGYKLFYFRRKKGLSHTKLGRIAGVKRNLLTSLENVRTPAAAKKSGSIFRFCSTKDLRKIENVLGLKGRLAAGQKDDLLSMYIQYYHSNRGKSTILRNRNEIQNSKIIFPTKCVIFDFDGTLTIQNDRTTWELIWEELGYSIEDCARLHRDFSNKVISHREWCDRTCQAFNDKLISEKTLVKIASKLNLINGAPELVKILQENKIEMHILSGSVIQIIYNVLGGLVNYFTNIQANSFKFTGGALSYIHGTEYDFEGKAEYINELMKIKKYSASEVLFVGNSSNDGRSCDLSPWDRIIKSSED